MRPGGLVLVIAGVWVLAQVFRGDMLSKLKITGSGGGDSIIPPTGPITGIPYSPISTTTPAPTARLL